MRALRRRDPVLGAAIRRAGPCRLRVRGDPYGSLLRSILYQQLAGAAASAIERRFVSLYGGRYPRPDALLDTCTERLRGAGLSRQKARYLQNVARAFQEGSVRGRRLYHMDEEAVIATLTGIVGVGTWTAHMILLFSLGRPDVLPVGDYGIRKGAQLLYGLDSLPIPSELEALAEPWRPWRSVASWYLWRVLDAAD